MVKCDGCGDDAKEFEMLHRSLDMQQKFLCSKCYQEIPYEQRIENAMLQMKLGMFESVKALKDIRRILMKK